MADKHQIDLEAFNKFVNDCIEYFGLKKPKRRWHKFLEILRDHIKSKPLGNGIIEWNPKSDIGIISIKYFKKVQRKKIDAKKEFKELLDKYINPRIRFLYIIGLVEKENKFEIGIDNLLPFPLDDYDNTVEELKKWFDSQDNYEQKNIKKRLKSSRRIDLSFFEKEKKRIKKKSNVVFENTTRPAFLIDQTNASLINREEITKTDIDDGSAIIHDKAYYIAEMIDKQKNVAIQGRPGTGKSGLTAIVDWILRYRKNIITNAYLGKEFQDRDISFLANNIASDIAEKKVSTIIIDDVHLIKDAVARLRREPFMEKINCLFVGREPSIEEGSKYGLLPHIDHILNITHDNYSSYIARELAIKILCDNKKTGQLLESTKSDLVLTKWMLAGIEDNEIIWHEKPAKLMKVQFDKLVDNYGGETLRLLLVLSAFRWLEISCPESFLSDVLNFNRASFSNLIEKELEGIPDPSSVDSLSLARHPKLCEFFLDNAHTLGAFLYNQTIFDPTCNALKVNKNAVSKFGFSALIIGAAIDYEFIHLDSIEQRLIFGQRMKDFYNIVIAAIECELGKERESQNAELSSEDVERRLVLCSGITNCTRRINGGTKADMLYKDLRRKLRIPDMPSQLFAKKGYILHQEARTLFLLKQNQESLQKFDEAINVYQKWDMIHNSAIHRGMAASSLIAKEECNLEYLMFHEQSPGKLNPNKKQIKNIIEIVKEAFKVVEEAMRIVSGNDMENLLRFQNKATHVIGEAYAWMGNEQEARVWLIKHGEPVKGDHTDRIHERAKQKVEAVLYHVIGHYDKVIQLLKNHPEERIKSISGDGAGKSAALLVYAYKQLQMLEEAEKMRLWILSDKCVADKGNVLAKKWAENMRRIVPA